MERGLIIYRINKDDEGNAGVIKKCKAQVEAFRNSGKEVDVFWLCNSGVLKNEELVYEKKMVPHTIGQYWFYLVKFGRLITKFNTFNTYDFVYLRHPFYDPRLVGALKKIKKENPKIKTLLEINTFPYDAEPKRILHKASLFLDKMYRAKAKHFIDRIIHYGSEKSIWEIPTINIRNGIQLDKIESVKREEETKRLRLIAVGNWSYWHGLDRLIAGLGEYYQNSKPDVTVTLNIIGNLPKDLGIEKQIVNEGLQDYVNLIPSAYGEELTAFFNISDVGVGTLAIHRKGVKLDSSLKHREYCARGIPFIIGGKDLDFIKNLDFVFYANQNDDEIKIRDLVTYYYEKNLSNRTLDIIAYARKHLSWETKLKPVFEYIEGA